MTDRQFTEGDRVYHRQVGKYGTYAGQVGHDTSDVDFGYDPELADDVLCVTTAQLVPADEVNA